MYTSSLKADHLPQEAFQRSAPFPRSLYPKSPLSGDGRPQSLGAQSPIGILDLNRFGCPSRMYSASSPSTHRPCMPEYLYRNAYEDRPYCAGDPIGTFHRRIPEYQGIQSWPSRIPNGPLQPHGYDGTPSRSCPINQASALHILTRFAQESPLEFPWVNRSGRDIAEPRANLLVSEKMPGYPSTQEYPKDQEYAYSQYPQPSSPGLCNKDSLLRAPLDRPHKAGANGRSCTGGPPGD